MSTAVREALRVLQSNVRKNAPRVRKKFCAVGRKDEALTVSVAMHLKTLERLASLDFHGGALT